MTEKELDSSVNSYNEIERPKNYAKQLQWDMAIGLQEVDNLKPSKYLEKLLSENVTGEKTIYEVEHELKQYYIEKEKDDKVNHNELECDLVSTRIVELLQEDYFELSIDYLKYVHKYLFQDVYEFAGEFRKVDFSKCERILNNDSVGYGDYKLLKQSLDYDISLEKSKNYKSMNIVDVINNITDFSSRVWQIHPFRNGNGRTSRLIMNMELMRSEYVPDIIKKDNRLKYYETLDKAYITEDYTDFVKLVTEAENEMLDRYLSVVD